MDRSNQGPLKTGLLDSAKDLATVESEQGVDEWLIVRPGNSENTVKGSENQVEHNKPGGTPIPGVLQGGYAADDTHRLQPLPEKRRGNVWLQVLSNYQTQIVVIVVPIIGYFLFFSGAGYNPYCYKKDQQWVYNTTLNETEPCNPVCILKNKKWITPPQPCVNKRPECITEDKVLIEPPEPCMPEDAKKCGFVLFVMACYWTLQAAPLAITSLLPVVLFPLLNVGKVKLKYPKGYSDTLRDLCPPFTVPVAARVSECYMKELQFLFIGGLIVALAIEEWNIHKRLALYVLSKSGAEPTKLMAGFMVITGFLSMWISNTATTALMIPIASAVHAQLFPTDEDTDQAQPSPQQTTSNYLGVPSNGARRTSMESGNDMTATRGTLISPMTSTTELVRPSAEPQQENTMNSMVHMDTDTGHLNRVATKRRQHSIMVGKALIISIAYGANIGGIGTIIGTPTNIILLSNKNDFPRIGDIEFVTWMVYAIPLVVICLIVCWAVLVLTFMGFRELLNTFKKNPDDAHVCQQFQDQLRSMGRMNYPSKVVGCYFLITALLWMTRALGGKGWKHFLDLPEAKDSTSAIMISFLLFVTPQKPRLFTWLRNGAQGPAPKPAPSLIEWKKVQKMLAWDVVLLLGGGFALAMMCQATGLSATIGRVIGEAVENVGDGTCILIAIAGISLTTGFTSNVSTAQVFLPILGELARARGMDVDRVMVPAAIACSFAFLLPISTAPNAIAFSTGKLVTTDMIKAGGLINIVLIIVLWLWNGTGILGVFPKSEVIPLSPVTTEIQTNSTVLV